LRNLLYLPRIEPRFVVLATRILTDVAEVTPQVTDMRAEGYLNQWSTPYGVCEIKKYIYKMASSGMLRRVALVRTGVSEELSAACVRCWPQLALFLVHGFLSP
jgi:hypothetical protein